jgi:hypothetical protein
VTVKNKRAVIIDITVPFENGMEGLTEARQHKLRKCEDLTRVLSNRFSEVKRDTTVFGSLGTWDPRELQANEDHVHEEIPEAFHEAVCVRCD